MSRQAVLDAVRQGCRTRCEVSRHARLPVLTVEGELVALQVQGRVVYSPRGWEVADEPSGSGRDRETGTADGG